MNKVLCNTKYLQLKSTLSKENVPWFYAHRPNAFDGVVILPQTKNEVLFLIETRPPLVAENIAEYVIGLPAGLVGDERENETIEDAVKAELMEEAGIEAKTIKIVLKNVVSSPGCVSEKFTIAIAYIEDKGIKTAPQSDGGIIIDRIWIKKENIYSWLKEKESEGYAISSQALAALFYLGQNGDLKNDY